MRSCLRERLVCTREDVLPIAPQVRVFSTANRTLRHTKKYRERLLEKRTIIFCTFLSSFVVLRFVSRLRKSCPGTIRLRGAANAARAERPTGPTCITPDRLPLRSSSASSGRSGNCQRQSVRRSAPHPSSSSRPRFSSRFQQVTFEGED
ncbi:hypothetical protein PUN28_013380 [Cardiocondyla obscurior]|uniref:Transmembrane protein n=1 Tax=Cardiocondyla obscurior TaxID=286306 RepID=A0AAW2FDS9_9HYME